MNPKRALVPSLGFPPPHRKCFDIYKLIWVIFLLFWEVCSGFCETLSLVKWKQALWVRTRPPDCRSREIRTTSQSQSRGVTFTTRTRTWTWCFIKKSLHFKNPAGVLHFQCFQALWWQQEYINVLLTKRAKKDWSRPPRWRVFFRIQPLPNESLSIWVNKWLCWHFVPSLISYFHWNPGKENIFFSLGEQILYSLGSSTPAHSRWWKAID